MMIIFLLPLFCTLRFYFAHSALCSCRFGKLSSLASFSTVHVHNWSVCVLDILSAPPLQSGGHHITKWWRSFASFPCLTLSSLLLLRCLCFCSLLVLNWWPVFDCFIYYMTASIDLRNNCHLLPVFLLSAQCSYLFGDLSLIAPSTVRQWALPYETIGIDVIVAFDIVLLYLLILFFPACIASSLSCFLSWKVWFPAIVSA